jgi:signal transduction histidine kinase
LWRTSVTIAELEATVARYLGTQRTRRSFDEFAHARDLTLVPGAEADIRMLRYAEHLLASAVGAASARLVLALMLERNSANTRGAMKLLDDASAAIQYNRDLLQSAIDQVRQGIAVFDANMNLICWNRQFRSLLYLPADMGRVGVPLDELMRTVLEGSVEDIENELSKRIEKLTRHYEPYQERIGQDGTVLEVRSSKMPDGGVVVTFADITERVLAAEALERRVQERTAELTALNSELISAKAAADEANLDKTRFIAAASHDILQPLNAARLFTSSLVERARQEEHSRLVGSIDASLESVEEILTALLDISRLDAGALQPELSVFRIDEIIDTLSLEVSAGADARGIDFTTVPCSLSVRSDRRLLRRALQNLLSNAIKYAPGRQVLFGCRRVGDSLRIEVHDTGPGIPEHKQRDVFREFERLAQKGDSPGLGLGLSIVERIARVLGHDLKLRSEPGRGTVFSIEVPLATVQLARTVGVHEVPQPSAGTLANLNVLVIDNEAAIIAGMRSLLEGWGCTVQAMNSAAELDNEGFAAPARPGIIIADYHLGGDTNGLDVIERLRHRYGYPVPAILITADRTKDVRERATALGVTFLQKPVKPAALRTAMAHSTIRQHAAE